MKKSVVSTKPVSTPFEWKNPAPLVLPKQPRPGPDIGKEVSKLMSTSDFVVDRFERTEEDGKLYQITSYKYQWLSHPLKQGVEGLILKSQESGKPSSTSLINPITSAPLSKRPRYVEFVPTVHTPTFVPPGKPTSPFPFKKPAPPFPFKKPASPAPFKKPASPAPFKKPAPSVPLDKPTTSPAPSDKLAL